MDIMTSCLQMGPFWRGNHRRKRPEADRKCRRADRHTPAVMSSSDPTAVLAEMKRTEALLRDARSVLRRVERVGCEGEHVRRSKPRAHCRGADRLRAPSVAVGPSPANRTALRQAGWRAACADAPRTPARDMSSATTVPGPGASPTSPNHPGISPERRSAIGEMGRPSTRRPKKRSSMRRRPGRGLRGRPPPAMPPAAPHAAGRGRFLGVTLAGAWRDDGGFAI